MIIKVYELQIDCESQNLLLKQQIALFSPKQKTSKRCRHNDEFFKNKQFVCSFVPFETFMINTLFYFEIGILRPVFVQLTYIQCLPDYIEILANSTLFK